MALALNEIQKEKLVAFGSTFLGRVLLSFFFIVEMMGLYALASGGKNYQTCHVLLLLLVASVVAQAKTPKLKGIFLSGGCALFFASNLHIDFAKSAFLTLVIVVLLLSFAALILWLAQKLGRKFFFAHFVRNTLLLIGALGAASCIPSLPKWAVQALIISALVCSSLIWFLAYAVHDRTGRKSPTLFQSLGFVPAFWGGCWEPNGKGWNYSAKFLAKSSKDLVESQLSSLKILFGLIFLDLLQIALSKGGGFLHLTSQLNDILNFAHGQAMNRWASWEILILHFFNEMLEMTIWGNLIVAIAHFTGFRIPKKTISPLLSRSLADFWNRYNFYFKELLVDFFFIPTFRKLMHIPEKWRVFIATLAAAGIGNYVCHLIKAIYQLPKYGILPYLLASSTYAFYCLILALGIAVSQLLTPHGYLEKKFRLHICLSVLTFFALIKVFDYAPGYFFAETHGEILSLRVFLNYFAYLFGVSFYA